MTSDLESIKEGKGTDVDRLPPLTFTPRFQPYVWGGRRLAEWFPSAPQTGPVAEAWVVSDVDTMPTPVASGLFSGWTLSRLIEEVGPRLLGGGRWSRFPLLLKFLDAQQRLSVQVHPDDERAGPNQQGKTEAWVVLAAESGGHVFAGFRRGVTEADVRSAIGQERLPELLHRIDVQPGDLIYLPAGTVHAIGSGLFLFEIQQTSDLTYRLYDWGRPRPLQIDRALACVDWSRGPISPMRPGDGLVLDSPYFRLWRHRLDQPRRIGTRGQCRLVVVTSGVGVLDDGTTQGFLHPGAVWMIPAETGEVECRPTTALDILECGLPVV